MNRKVNFECDNFKHLNTLFKLINYISINNKFVNDSI